MDRTSLIGTIVCFLLLIGWYEYVNTKYPYHPPAPALVNKPVSAPTETSLSPAISLPQAPAPAPNPVSPPLPEVTTVLENEQIKATLSSTGATIKTVELKKYKETANENILINATGREGLLTLLGWGQARFTVKVSQPESVTYASDLPGNLHWERTYTLGKDYVLSVEDRLTNSGTAEATLPTYSLYVGPADPLHIGTEHQSSSANVMYLGAGWLTSHFHTVTIGNFNPSKFLVFQFHSAHQIVSSTEFDQEPIKWIAAQNQFFASLLLPPEDRPVSHAEFRCYNERDASGYVPSHVDPQIDTLAWFPEVKIPAGQTVSLPLKLYTGPKEYDHLSALGSDQNQLMNYGYFEPLIYGFLRVLRFYYGLIGNWGVAIILLTLTVKIITWPLQSFANKSAKKMQALAPLAKELQAKYKDQPEKITSETMALYRDYGVNPLGGCLPALIQMPVFFSLYYMLQSAVELRGASFLWAHDLTLPDTIFTFAFMGGHYYLNPLPLMVTGTTMGMMRLSPMASADPQQAMIAKYVMPLVFLFIFYNFASALSLYYVVNNCVSMFQIYQNLRKPMPELKRKPRK